MAQLRLSEHMADSQTAFVLTSGNEHGPDIVKGLAERSMQAALISDQRDDDANFLSACFDSCTALQEAFLRAEECVGSPDLVVICIAPPAARQPRALESYSDEDWQAYCKAPLKSTLYCLQAAGKTMSEMGGAIVLLGPSVGYTGAANLVALSSLVEGQRGLAKAAARQLGPRGITVNWLTLASTGLYPELHQMALPQVPEMGPPPLPLGKAPGLEQIIPLLGFLGSPQARVLTGTSVIADGGEWMLP